MLRTRHLAALPFAVLILAILLGLLFGRGGTISTGAPPESFRLSNGMDVLVIPDHRAPVVTHMVWYELGAADEDAGKTGLAHFFEHLMFKGTDKVPSGEFSKLIARYGGSENAFTSYDYTGYYQVMSATNLPLSLI